MVGSGWRAAQDSAVPINICCPSPAAAATSQTLVSTTFAADAIVPVEAAIATLAEKLAPLIELSIDFRRSLAKKGEKSELLCRQTLMQLDQNMQLISPGCELAEAQSDLDTSTSWSPVSAACGSCCARPTTPKWPSVATS